MALHVGDEAPNFSAHTIQGDIEFHDWIGSGWAVLFSHPKYFTPVCTTELGYMAGLESEFDRRNTKLIGLSVDPNARGGAKGRTAADHQRCASASCRSRSSFEALWLG
jgi:alkyl hydroperoxide reductase subunit AhpC